VGHPCITSLWLGSLALGRSRLKGVVRHSLALFCVLPGYDQAFENRLTKGFKGPFVNLRTHSRVWMGSMLYKVFCLVYHWSRPNNREHKLAWLWKTAMKLRDKYIYNSIFWDLDCIRVVGLTIQIHFLKLDCQSQSNPTKCWCSR